jgi:hypothetical protein
MSKVRASQENARSITEQIVDIIVTVALLIVLIDLTGDWFFPLAAITVVGVCVMFRFLWRAALGLNAKRNG